MSGQARVRASFLFAWYDLWIGAYWDRNGRVLYILPLPCIGLKIEFGQKEKIDG